MNRDAQLELIVQNGALWSGPDHYWPQGQVEVSGGKVAYAGPEREAKAKAILDAGGGLIMPGLVNAHCHSPMVLFRGLADDLPLEAWLNEHIFPAEAKWVSEEMTEACTLLATAEMLLSGTTCVGDSYFCMHGAAKAYERSGMRAVAMHGVIDFPAPGVPDPAHNLDTAVEYVRAWQGRCPRLTPALFAHSTYTCSPETLRALADKAAELGVIWHTHLAESPGEMALVKEQCHTSPGRLLADLGLLDSLTAAVHGVWLDEEELKLLADHKVSTVHCPESNHKLSSGRANLPQWLKDGLNVGLGTDGAASNNDLDLIGELGFAAKAAKLNNLDPVACDAVRVLDMALGGSAKALGLEGLCGRLLPGYHADLMVLDTNQPHLTPLAAPASALAYQARKSDVRHVVVDGEVVVKDRGILSFDQEEAMADVRRMASALGAAS